MFVYFLYKGTTYVGVGWGLPQANIAFSSIFEIFAGHDKSSLLIFTHDAEVDNITLLSGYSLDIHPWCEGWGGPG